METILTAQMIEALSTGKFTEFLGFVAIFVFLWVEVRGLKKEVSRLNDTLDVRMSEGEHRFDNMEQRLTLVEQRKCNCQ
jgi:hypothetical protein